MGRASSCRRARCSRPASSPTRRNADRAPRARGRADRPLCGARRPGERDRRHRLRLGPPHAIRRSRGRSSRRWPRARAWQRLASGRRTTPVSTCDEEERDERGQERPDAGRRAPRRGACRSKPRAGRSELQRTAFAGTWAGSPTARLHERRTGSGCCRSCVFPKNPDLEETLAPPAAELEQPDRDADAAAGRGSCRASGAGG